MAYESVQNLTWIIGIEIEAEQNLVYAHTCESAQSILFTGPFEALQNLTWQISAQAETVQNILYVIGADKITSYLNILYAIDEQTQYESAQDIRWAVGEPAPIIRSVPYRDILIDGISVKDTDATFTIAAGAAHNEITINASDRQLYYKVCPDNSNRARIRVTIGSRTLDFMIEERLGNVLEYQIKGRSLSALDDNLAEEVTLDGAMSIDAAIAAAGFVNSVTWNAARWTLPDDFSFTGTPIQLLTELAEAIGAVIYPGDQGGITVVSRFSVRPADMAGVVADVVITDDDVLEFTYAIEPGDGRDATYVDGWASSAADIELEIEAVEGQRIRGQESFVRMYLKGAGQTAPQSWASDGNINEVGIATETVTELAEFVSGAASVRYPIRSLDAFTWLGSDGGTVNTEQYTRDLTLDSDQYGVAIVQYTTEFRRFRLYGHDVASLVAVIGEGVSSGVSVSVATVANPTRPAEIADAPLLTTDAAAITRAIADHDRYAHDVEMINVTIPYDDNATDGAIVYIDAWLLGITGNFKINRANIVMQGPDVTNQLELIRCII